MSSDTTATPQSKKPSQRGGREIVAEAWEIVQEYRSELIVYGFVPAFFSILITGFYVVYQIIAFRDSDLFDGERSSELLSLAVLAWEIFTSSALTISLTLIVVLVVAGMSFFSPFMSRGVIIDVIGQVRQGKQKDEVLSSLALSFPHFYELMGTEAMSRFMSIRTYFSLWAAFARTFSLEFAQLMLPLLILLWSASQVAAIFLAFLNVSIVLLNRPFMKSVKTSSLVASWNIWNVVKVVVLVFLIELRVILNVLIVFLLPILMIGMVGALASFLSIPVAIFLVSIVGLGLLVLAAYLTGILFILQEAIWVIAFYEMTKKMQDRFDRSELRDAEDSTG